MRNHFLHLAVALALGSLGVACDNGETDGAGAGGGSGGEGTGADGTGGDGTGGEGTGGGGVGSMAAAQMGGNHACAVGTSGKVYCWGNHSYGELGTAATEDQYSPVAVSGLHDVVQLALGGQSSCALHSDGTVSCWGRNSAGELGIGVADEDDHVEPTQVPGLTDIVQIAIASNGDGEHACAVRSDGALLCWGINFGGQLGLGVADMDAHADPAEVPGLPAVAQVSLNISTSCAVTTDGAVYCWGANDNAELGEATASETCEGAFGPFPCETAPVEVAGVSGAVKVAAGFFSTHVLLDDGTVVSWGGNMDGALGTGVEEFGPFPSPQAVDGLSGVVDLAASGSASSDSACAVTSDGSVYCWGSNRPYEQLAESAGDVAGETTPKQISGLTGTATNVSMSVSVLVQMDDGSVWGWGANGAGQLGRSFQSGSEHVPAAVGGLD